jgi:hypothetical protein
VLKVTKCGIALFFYKGEHAKTVFFSNEHFFLMATYMEVQVLWKRCLMFMVQHGIIAVVTEGAVRFRVAMEWSRAGSNFQCEN